MNEKMNELCAISALDGRYRSHMEELSKFVSEKALIRYRIKTELLWLLHLAKIKEVSGYLKIDDNLEKFIRDTANNLPEDAAKQVKEIEQKTNHDVKSVEYYLRSLLTDKKASNSILSFLHFACTSEDINNISYALMLEEARSCQILPKMDLILEDLTGKAKKYAPLAMLARTHGQPASPTTLGKEFTVFEFRLKRQRDQFASTKLAVKMNGAVGNFNAHLAAFPSVDWQNVTREFIEKEFNFEQNPYTTQIENHDSLIEYFDCLRRFNVILLGLCRDIWSYISIGYFTQKVNPNEVGSSTMPHKVNPIDFENAEGNLGLSVSLSQHFAEKLPISRWQRDLSDSTVLRSCGSILGYSVVSYNSVLKGLSKIEASGKRISDDLDLTWEVISEPVQTVLRARGVIDAYERLKTLTRGKPISRDTIAKFIETSDELTKEDKTFLLALTPKAYVGLAKEITLKFVDGFKKENK